jgi:ectoine hydroxylase
MPEPRAMNIAVFMDEVMPINGPLMLIPRSHKHGVLAAGHDEEMTSYPLWTLDQETVTRLVQEAGIVAPTGRPESVLMFHGNLVHGSAPNITPCPRRIVYLTLCAVSNRIRKPTRPEWIAHRDFTPIEPVADTALPDYARAYAGGECGRRPAMGAVWNTGNSARPTSRSRRSDLDAGRSAAPWPDR